MSIFIRSLFGKLGIKEVKLEEHIDLTKDKINFLETYNHEKILSIIKREAPVDGREIVEWMQYAGAANILGEKLASRIKSVTNTYLKWVSGDPYIPGVRNDEYRVESIPGYQANYARIYRDGRVVLTVPYGEKGISKDLKVQGLYRWRRRMQWLFDVIKNEIPRLPIQESIPLPSMPVIGQNKNLAPSLPISYTLIRPALRTTFWIQFSTQNIADINIKFLTSDYIPISETKIEVRSGTSTYRIIASVPMKGYILIDPRQSEKAPLTPVSVDYVISRPPTI